MILCRRSINIPEAINKSNVLIKEKGKGMKERNPETVAVAADTLL